MPRYLHPFNHLSVDDNTGIDLCFGRAKNQKIIITQCAKISYEMLIVQKGIIIPVIKQRKNSNVICIFIIMGSTKWTLTIIRIENIEKRT